MVEQDRSTENGAGNEQTTRNILDQLFVKEEDTVEDLINSFRYLKDVRCSDVSQMNGYHSTEEASAVSMNVRETNWKERKTSCCSDEDSLAEEELGPGSILPSPLYRKSSEKSGLLTKFDNFMEDDLSDLSSLSEEEGENGDSKKKNDVAKEEGNDTTNRCNSSLCQTECSFLIPTADSMPCNESWSFTISYLNTVSASDPLCGQTVQEETAVAESTSCETSRMSQVSNYQALINNNSSSSRESPSAGDEASETLGEKFELDKDFDYDNVKCTPKLDLRMLRADEWKCEAPKADSL